MSDLVVNYENLSGTPEACSQEPPVPTKQDPNPKDGCSLTLPLVDENDAKAQARLLRFDRKGPSFVLSSANDADDLTWVSRHGSIAPILDVLRMTGTLLRANEKSTSSAGLQIFLTITQFLATDKVRFGKALDSFPEIPEGVGNRLQLASFLLEIFTQNSDDALKKLLGALAILRGDKNTSKEVSDRIAWISDVMGLRPAYLKFSDHFVEEKDLANLEADDRSSVIQVLRWVRQAVVQNSLHEDFRYDSVFTNAFLAYQKLPFQKTMKEKGDFCDRFAAAMTELGVNLPPDFKSECRQAIKLLSLTPEIALKQSLRENWLSDEGGPFLQNLIKDESSRSNMSVEWLKSRGTMQKVTNLLLTSLQVKIPNDEHQAPTLSWDPKSFGVNLDILMGENLTTRREYLLAALALLRRVLDEKENPRPLHAFYSGRFSDLSVAKSEDVRSEFQSLVKRIEGELSVSESHSEKWLPWAEAGTCVLGVGGLAYSQNFISSPSHESLQFGLGLGSSVAAGGGCSALLAHYVLPKVTKVRNRYLWEGLVGAGGAILVTSLFLWRWSGQDHGDRTRFPTYGYGP